MDFELRKIWDIWELMLLVGASPEPPCCPPSCVQAVAKQLHDAREREVDGGGGCFGRRGGRSSATVHPSNGN